ncbi:MAG TPA: polysaccharide deacetylase family protein [Candidatus Agathobaculum stercoravium]|nr:polysaccharide deacetylase family protein [Candidatus Agathobaculum stercoravium]
MSYQSAYRSAYRPYRRRRRRRRNSHYGVLIALILVVVIAVPVAFHIVKGISGAIFGGDQNQLVYQVDNTRAWQDGKAVDLGAAAPYRNTSGVVYVSMSSLCDNLGMELTWDEASKTASTQFKQDKISIQAGSTTLRFNEENKTMAAAPEVKDGVVFAPVRDICEAFSWQVGELGADQGDLVVVSQSKKELDEKRLGKIAEKALKVLGPSEQQVTAGSIIMRTDSDKLVADGENRQMTEEEGKRGTAAIEVDGTRYVPLKAAITALGGSASFDGKSEWTVEYNGIQSTVQSNGKAKVDGDRIRGDGIEVYQDEESGKFYVSAELFAALTGKNYTDLGEGAYAFTNMPLDGFDSQKAYLSSMESGLTQAIGADIPEADVYVALTFDDGPTGSKDGYPDGMTATLLDGLKERGAHATFFMCGYRLKDFHSHCARYLAEGHELGNHTMNHPMQMLPAMSEEEIREEVESNSQLIEQYCGERPTVMRPVGGAYDDKVKAVMKELGLPIINWDVDTLDWKTKTDPVSVKNNIINQVEDGSVVLMHDLYSGTIEGVLAAIDELQSRTDKTYAFVTVSELAAVKGISLEPGQVYTKIG